VLDLGPRARVVFAAGYLAAQGALVATAPLRPDHAFGFQMFSESSTMSIHLSRRLRSGGSADVPSGGEWTAPGPDGAPRRFSWRDRIKDPLLGNLDTTMQAAYGAAAQVARVQAALDDVAAHLDGDAETRALVADVTIRKNGRDPATVQLTSAPPR
jgi:hypothetical protein